MPQPAENTPQEPKKMDPRQKEGQGLEFWARSLREQGALTQEAYDDFIAQNNSKEESMAKRGLPQLKHYGLFNSADEIREKLSPHKDERFIIRCSSKETGDIKRLIDTGLEEACAFADILPGGFEKWDVEMKEFVHTKASGTIIVEPSGRTVIETWEGSHYLNTTNVPKYSAEFDPEVPHQRFHWEAPDGAVLLPELQEYAIHALRYIFPYLKPHTNEQVYVEYGVKPGGEIYFLDVNDSSLLTGKSANTSTR